MIVGPNGQQVSDGPTGRAIVITEHIVEGIPRWGVEGQSDIDILEAVQVLSEVIRAVVVQQRQLRVEKKIMSEVKEKLDSIKGNGNE